VKRAVKSYKKYGLEKYNPLKIVPSRKKAVGMEFFRFIEFHRWMENL